MTCGHCQSKVEKALNALDGVIAKVDLKKKQANIKTTIDIKDEMLRNTVEQTGYEVVSIEDKKSLFGK